MGCQVIVFRCSLTPDCLCIATRCGPCVLLAKELDRVAADLGEGVKILKVDTDENPELSSQLQARVVPCRGSAATPASPVLPRVAWLSLPYYAKNAVVGDTQSFLLFSAPADPRAADNGVCGNGHHQASAAHRGPPASGDDQADCGRRDWRLNPHLHQIADAGYLQPAGGCRVDIGACSRTVRRRQDSNGPQCQDAAS